MPISTNETVPNFPLNGAELGKYICILLAKEAQKRLPNDIAEVAVQALELSLVNDWVFRPNTVWAGTKFTIACQFHLCGDRFAFRIEPLFEFPTNPAFAKHEPFVRQPIAIATPPLLDCLESESIAVCFTIAGEVKDPNLIRVHCGMPILLQAKIPPKHGELFPRIEDHETIYDPKDYPPLPEPQVADTSAHFARQWGIANSAGAAVSEPTAPIAVSVPADAPLEGAANGKPGVGVESNLEFPAPPSSVHETEQKRRDRKGWRK